MNRRTDADAGVVGSLSAAVGRLRRQPIIVAGAFVVTLLSSLVALVGLVNPVVGNVTSILWTLVWPFLIAGFLGMVTEARSGETHLATLLSAGRSHYLSMLGATLFFTAIAIGVGILSVVLTALVLLVAVAGTAGGLFDGGVSLLLVAVALLFVLPYALVYLCFQFYDVGIVDGGERAISSFAHSFALVREHVLAVVGYTIVFALVQAIGYGPGYAVLFLGGLELTDTGEWVIASEPLVAAGSLLLVGLGSLAMALAFTYHVTFYESLTTTADTRVNG